MTTETDAMDDNATATTKPESKTGFIKDFLIVGSVLVSIFIAHQQNLKNIEKMNSIIVKYETQIDKMILSDDKTHAKYIKNLKEALKSLSKEERKVLLAIYSVDK